MPFYFSLAFKNIFRQKKRSFTLGINYWVVSILLVLLFAVTDGVKKNIAENLITASAGHLSLSGEIVLNGRTLIGIADAPGVLRVLADTFPDARLVSRYSVTSTIYHAGLSKRLSFTGINATEDHGIRDQIEVVQGSWEDYVSNPNAALIPKEIADYFGLAVGDEVVIAARSRFGAFNTGIISIAGIYVTGNFFIGNIVISHFDFCQSLDLGSENLATSIFVYFPDLSGLYEKRAEALKVLEEVGYVVSVPQNTTEGIAVITSASPSYKQVSPDINERRLRIGTLDEVLGLVSQVIGTVNLAGGFLASLLFFIIAVSIFINLRMTINDRMQEIGTLRAMGTEAGDVVRLFLLEMVLLGAVFTVAGIVSGTLVSWILSSVLTLPQGGWAGLFLNQGRPVLVPSLGASGIVLLVTALFTAVFSYFPARYGGRIRAVEALNKNY